jgi:hypothetical protein
VEGSGIEADTASNRRTPSRGFAYRWTMSPLTVVTPVVCVLVGVILPPPVAPLLVLVQSSVPLKLMGTEQVPVDASVRTCRMAFRTVTVQLSLL